MIRRFLALPAAMLLVSVVGCSSLDVNYDFDNNVDFAQFRSYAWMPRPESAPADARQASERNDLLDRRIRNAVEAELQGRGLKADAEPDLLVVYHTGVEDKVQVTDWGYSYSDYYWGYGGRQIDVHQFTEGTLIIDLIDTGTRNLVWRGSGTGVVDKKQRSPEEMQARIDEIVTKIMESFPPTGR